MEKTSKSSAQQFQEEFDAMVMATTVPKKHLTKAAINFYLSHREDDNFLCCPSPSSLVYNFREKNSFHFATLVMEQHKVRRNRIFHSIISKL